MFSSLGSFSTSLRILPFSHGSLVCIINSDIVCTHSYVISSLYNASYVFTVGFVYWVAQRLIICRGCIIALIAGVARPFG